MSVSGAVPTSAYLSSTSSVLSSEQGVQIKSVHIAITAQFILEQATSEIDAHLARINAELVQYANVLKNSLICKRKFAICTSVIGSIASITSAVVNGISSETPRVGFSNGYAFSLGGVLLSLFIGGIMYKLSTHCSKQDKFAFNKIKDLKSESNKFNIYREQQTFLETAYCEYHTQLRLGQYPSDRTFIHFLQNEKNLTALQHQNDEKISR